MAIDVDPEGLAGAAAASAHAFEQAIVHIGEEIKARDPNNLDPLVNTLATEGPYGYTLVAQFEADGQVRLPVFTTREEITEVYAFIRGMSDLHEVVGLTEVRGGWYLFQDSISRGSAKGSDSLNDNHVLGIFPSGAGTGITGELVWRRVPRAQLGAPDEVDVALEDPLLAREQVHDEYVRYLEALRANDGDAVTAVLHPLGASVIRDYVQDSGTVVELVGQEAHEAWYEGFFQRFEVRSVQPLVQVTEDWYVFAELRVTVVERDGGAERSFHTAEFHIPAKDGRFIARIGHGTEPTAT